MNNINGKDVIVGGEEVFYLFEEKVYRCIYHEGDVWIGIPAILKLMNITLEKFLAVLNELHKKGIIPTADGYKYYFYDGNMQGFTNIETHYYNSATCIALSVALKNYGMLGYFSYVREVLARFGSNNEQSVKKFENSFLGIRKVSHQKGEVVVAHQHNCYELVYYVSGSGKTSSEYSSSNFTADTLLLVEPQVRHEEYHTENSECICLTFYVDPPLKGFVITPTEELLPTIRNLYDCLLSIFSLLENEQKDYEFQNKIIMIGYLLNKLLKMTTKESSYFDAAVDYTKKYIDSNYSHKINFHILSEQVGYSLNYLNMLFKRKMGMSIYEYLLEVRLLKAKDMLVNSNAKLSKISAKCGFASESRFSQFFKERMGVAPLVYRKISNSIIEGGIISSKKSD